MLYNPFRSPRLDAVMDFCADVLLAVAFAWIILPAFLKMIAEAIAGVK